MNELIDKIFGDKGLIKSHKANYVKRDSQVIAADRLLSALENGEHMIMEGPCGFGKTFAYLFPIFIDLAGTEKKCIIATNGIGLSEQLIYQDLPLVSEISNELGSRGIKFALLKGRANFLCPLKLGELKVMGDDILDTKEGKAIEKWSRETATGDLSELPFKPDFDLLSAVACVSDDECGRKHCPMYNECFHAKHREKALNSQIIVTNYHMLFSDYETGGAILPEYQILVLDEAHETANIFRDFTERKFSSGGISYKESRLSNQIKKTEAGHILMDVDRDGEYFIVKKLRNLATIMSRCEDQAKYKLGPYEQYKLIDDDIPYSSDMLATVKDLIAEIQGDIAEYNTFLASFEDDAPEDAVQIYHMLESLSEYLEDFKNLLAGYSMDEFKNKYAYYYERQNDSIKICMKYIKVGELLYKRYFADPTKACILTSATLSTNGNFDFIKTETGLNLSDRVAEYIGESPFDMSKQQLWFMSENAVNGNDVSFEDSMEYIVPELISATNGGILFLCTSNRNMNRIYEVARRCDYAIYNGIRILKQGDMPNKQLAEEFRNDKDSILVATKSFFTGIDIPGDSLRCVAIDKFPFPSPADPVMKRISEMEENSFYRYSIPMMITSLKQAVGRGVRSIDDKCVIAIMDKRIKTARYRYTVIKSFNYEKVATRDPNRIREFLSRG